MYLSVPASSAERMFSISGHIFSVKRRRLGIKYFTDLVYLKLNELFMWIFGFIRSVYFNQYYMSYLLFNQLFLWYDNFSNIKFDIKNDNFNITFDLTILLKTLIFYSKLNKNMKIFYLFYFFNFIKIKVT